MSEPQMWKRLCGKAVQLCGSQTAFQQQARILKRLVQQFGPEEVERMIAGARLLGWTDLRSLGSKEGLGRRWAIEAFWRSENARSVRLPERVKEIMRRAGT